MDIRDIRLFMLDMDGTFNLGETLIPGSLDFMNKVITTGRDFLFVTNNSSHNAQYYVERLRRLGFETTRDKVLTSGEATAAIIAAEYPGQTVSLLGNSFLREEFAEAGVPLQDEGADIAVIGFDTTLDYAKMTRICDEVRRGIPYIATHPDFNCPTETGFIPDAGAIIAFIEASTGRRPDRIIGKPYGGIVEAALKRAKLKREELAMVGDRLYTDIATGLNNGITSILVMTGETTREMLEKSDIVPDLVYGSLGEMAGEL